MARKEQPSASWLTSGPAVDEYAERLSKEKNLPADHVAGVVRHIVEGGGLVPRNGIAPEDAPKGAPDEPTLHGRPLTVVYDAPQDMDGDTEAVAEHVAADLKRLMAFALAYGDAARLQLRNAWLDRNGTDAGTVEAWELSVTGRAVDELCSELGRLARVAGVVEQASGEAR